MIKIISTKPRKYRAKRNRQANGLNEVRDD